MPQMMPQMPPAFGANPYGGMMAQQQQPEAQAPPAAPTPDPALAAMQAQIAALQAQLLAANTPEAATVRHAFPQFKKQKNGIAQRRCVCGPDAAAAAAAGSATAAAAPRGADSKHAHCAHGAGASDFASVTVLAVAAAPAV